MKITRIEKQKKRQDRVNVYADDEFLIGISLETLLRLGLRKGDELSAATLAVIEKTEEQHGARAAALRLLAVRPRSERELRDRLREKEFGDEEIRKTIDALSLSGLINDAEVARVMIRNARALKPAGRMALARKLLGLGIAKDTVNNALDELLGGTAQHGDALQAAEGFLRRVRPASTPDARRRLRQRLTAFLLRRGFPWEVVSPVVKEAMQGGEPNEGKDSESRI
jgi:regulatory protein